MSSDNEQACDGFIFTHILTSLYSRRHDCVNFISSAFALLNAFSPTTLFVANLLYCMQMRASSNVHMRHIHAFDVPQFDVAFK